MRSSGLSWRTRVVSFFTNYKIIAAIYLITAAASALAKFVKGPQAYNNYLIFKHVFYNTLEQINLYLPYPEKFLDINHYGILFSLVIAPFAVLPDGLGMTLWNIANAAMFIFAVYQLPFALRHRSLFAWLCLQEFITAAVSFQFNIGLAGLIIYAATCIYRQKEVQSAAATMLGTFIKLYGIVGLSQFFFVRHKLRYVLSLFAFGILFLVLPMLISSPQFGLQAYQDWFTELAKKNALNVSLDSYQDISIMGVVRRLAGDATIPNLYFYIFGLPLFFLPYLRTQQYKAMYFQLLTLASSLLFMVLFSSGSESPTYILAVSGVMIWFFSRERWTKLDFALLIFVLLLTCFSTSDLFPAFVKKNYIVKYSLKAVPCFVVWLKVQQELMFRNFNLETRAA